MWSSFLFGIVSIWLPGGDDDWYPFGLLSEDQACNPKKDIHFYLHKISVSTGLFCLVDSVSA